MTILADSAERIDEIDVNRAEEARRRAEEAIRNRGEAVEIEEALAALRRANLRLNVGRRHRRPPDGPRRGHEQRQFGIVSPQPDRRRS